MRATPFHLDRTQLDSPWCWLSLWMHVEYFNGGWLILKVHILMFSLWLYWGTFTSYVWYLIDEKRRWPPLERISTFEYMNLEGSKAAPGFPGFVFLYVCIRVRPIRMSQSILVFPGPPPAELIYFVWNEMGRIVCLDTMYHSLTSLYFPSIVYTW